MEKINKIKNKTFFQKGAMIVYLVVIIFIFSVVMIPLLGIILGQINVLKSAVLREQSLNIAEAGINYYQWRLAHFPNDYTDGTGESGPYEHSYYDRDNQKLVGKFSLEIIPPSVGSTILTIKSTGWTNENPDIKRSIIVRYGVHSLSKYAFLSNDVIWIGDTENVSGLMHSNNGIRFDGIGNAPITSSKSTYICPSSQGSPCPTTKPGVWGSASQFVQNFWQFPVPAVDFSSLTLDLSSMKNLSQNGGVYLPPSNKHGYSLVFRSDGKIDFYKVRNVNSHTKGKDTKGRERADYTDYKNRDFEFTSNIPLNGIIYVEDNVWVEGVVNGRATVVSAKLPYNEKSAPNIYIPKNIVYNTKDGSSVLGLFSQKDIVVSYDSPKNLEINAAMIAQNGAGQFFYYNGVIKENITIYGSLISFGQWTWSWVTSSGLYVSGYPNTNFTYDANLLYSPPPYFPLSSSGYQQLDWKSN